MSVVCCKVTDKKIEIASDSILVSGDIQVDGNALDATKLFKTNGMIIGGSGDMSEIALLQIFCETHKPKNMSCDSVMTFFTEFVGWKQKKERMNMF